MDIATQRLIESLHQSPFMCVVAVTGGGTQAAAWLLQVPGGSRTILEIVVPYHERSLDEFLGHPPEQACSINTSREMARRAFERARWLAPEDPVLGIGCTASLATDRPKRGDHRFHITVCSVSCQTTYSLVLSKGARDREAEEMVLDAILLNRLAEAINLAERVPVPLLDGELVTVESQPLARSLQAFFRGELSRIRVAPDGQHSANAPLARLLLPGSFNPVHEGHWRLAAVAEKLTGLPAAFELSVTNVDKPPLSIEEVERRLQAFGWRAPVWLTRAPNFTEKAALFPGTIFVVGADTAARIVAPRYYQDSEERMNMALASLRAQDCRFLVAGRIESMGRFVGLDDVSIPSEFLGLFSGIPESDFREDISSTRIRQFASEPPG